MTWLRTLLGVLIICGWTLDTRATSNQAEPNERTTTQAAGQAATADHSQTRSRWRPGTAVETRPGVGRTEKSRVDLIFADGFESGNTLAWGGYTCETQFVIPTDLTGGS